MREFERKTRVAASCFAPVPLRKRSKTRIPFLPLGQSADSMPVPRRLYGGVIKAVLLAMGRDEVREKWTKPR